MRATLAIVAAAFALVGCSDDEPTTFTADDGSFSVLFPGEPELTTETTSTAGVELTFDIYSFDDSDSAFLVNQYDYRPLIEDAGLSLDDLGQFVDLDGAVDGAMSGMGGTATSVDSTTIEGRDARIVEFEGTREGQDFTGVAQVMADGPELYQVLALGTDDTDEYRSFVESFDFLTDAQGDDG